MSSKRITIFSDGAKVFVDNTTSQVVRKTEGKLIYVKDSQGSYLPFTNKRCDQCQDQVVSYKGRSYKGKIFSEDSGSGTITILSNGTYITTHYDSIETSYGPDDRYVVWDGRANLEYFTLDIYWESQTLLSLNNTGGVNKLNFFGIINHDGPEPISGDIKLVKTEKKSERRLRSPMPYQMSRSMAPMSSAPSMEMGDDNEDSEGFVYSTYEIGVNTLDGQSKVPIDSFDIQPTRYTLIDVLNSYQNKGQEAVVFKSPTYIPQGAIDIQDGDLTLSTQNGSTQRGEDVLIPLVTSKVVKYKSNINRRTNKISDYESETVYTISVDYQYVKGATKQPILFYVDVGGKMVKDVKPSPTTNISLKNKLLWIDSNSSGIFTCSFRTI